jgi:glucosamine--fructose-6-phosphate aminotransferase (isomerizing)
MNVNFTPSPPTHFDLLIQDIQRLPDLLEQMTPNLRRQAAEIAASISPRPPRVYLVGCGDSLNVGMAARFAWERLLRLPVEAVPAQTFARHLVESAPPGALVVAFSQSGKVSRVIEALRVGGARGLQTLAVCGRTGSPLALEPADQHWVFNFPKLGFVPGTTSYLTGIALYLELACALTPDTAQAGELQAAIDYLPEVIRAALPALQQTAQRGAADISRQHPLLLLGAGPQLASAHYAARKFFEISQVIAMAQETEEYAHDEYSVVDAQVPALIFAPPDRSYSRSREIAGWLRRLGLPLSAAASPACAADFEALGALVYPVPETHPDLAPLLYALPAQLLNYYTALRLGGAYYATHDPVHDADGDPQIYESEILDR